MNDATDEFVALGMSRYRDAARVLVDFGREVEARLKAILDERTSWGRFQPLGESSAKSTTYWSVYPLLNAKIDGEFRDENVKLAVRVNWYAADTHYPFYAVAFEGISSTVPMEQFEWNPNYQFTDGELRLNPDPDDFDLRRDVNRLLDEFQRFLQAS